MFDVFDMSPDVPEFETNALLRLIEIGLMSGSTVWGVDTEGSDIDIFLPSGTNLDAVREDYHVSSCLECDYDKEDFNAYRVEGTKYNLIVCHDQCIYESREYATNIFTELCNASLDFKELIKNKGQRVKMFIALCDQYEQEKC